MDHDSNHHLEDGRTMRYWLSCTLKEVRERAGQKPKTVAELAGVDASTISRFENNQAWPQKIDRMVAAYAMLSGVDDGRDLWHEAVERFRAQGGAPVLGELSSAQKSLRLALEAAQRQSPYGDESPSVRTSTRHARAGEESSRPTRRRSR
jgi:transcriptional regulator with XRE-family HTH domain